MGIKKTTEKSNIKERSKVKESKVNEVSKVKESSKDRAKETQVQTYDIAVLGATGTVGEAIISILEERQFPVGKLHPLASSRSAGETIIFNKKAVMVQDVETFDFSKVQLALFSAGSEVSAQYAKRATDAGCIVIDNTSKFRLDSDVPLIIPEVNAHRLFEYQKRNIIANPNCSTIQMLVALKPIYDAVGITRINIATYQSVSGTGSAAIAELANQTASLLNGQSIVAEVYPKQIAFNVLPHIGAFQDNGYTVEEMKLVWETQKIFEDPNIKINPTTVRVPVFYGHSEAIHIETREKITAAKARELLRQAPGVILIDEPGEENYPTPIPEASGTDAVYVGRIREDISHPLGLDLWVVADNVRKGAALNAVQIAEMLISEWI